MNTEEFSNEFDILYNSITSNQAPGLDEYEKSVFLTRAQEELIRNYFNPLHSKDGQGFDGNQKRQYDFSTLLCTAELQDVTMLAEDIIPSIDPSFNFTSFDSRSYIYKAPTDLFLSVNESIEDSAKRKYSVLPISYNEYIRLISKPYGYPLKRQAWRLITNTSSILAGWGCHTSRNRGFYAFKSKYNKPLLITVNVYSSTSTSDSLIAPTITESSDIVDIKLQVPSNRFVQYWTSYLASDSALKKAGLDKYLYPLNSSSGLFPTSDDVKTFTINISKAYNEDASKVKELFFEIIGKFSGTFDYTIRYVRTPKPIILVNLNNIGEGLSIKGYNTISECELPVNTHYEVLQRAVELAKAAYQGDAASILQVGSASGTDMGYVSQKQ